MRDNLYYNKNKDKTELSKGQNVFIIVLFVIFILSILIAVVLIVITVLPKFDLTKYYNFSKVIINGTNNAWEIMLALYIAFIGAFGVLLFKEKKNRKVFIKVIILLIFSLGVFSPLIVSGFSVEVIEVYSQQIEDLKDDEKESGNPDENKEEEESDEYEIIFIVDFNDVLFESYDVNIIVENKSLLEKQIFNQIHTKIENFNKDSDKMSFEKIKNEVDDYELTYKFYCDNGLFLKFNQEERINKLNDAIRIRKEANNQFKDSDNQRLIAIRYMELGDEMRSMGKFSESIGYYKLSIFWNLNALQTLYNEESNVNEFQMYTNIIRAYKYMMELFNEDDEYTRRSKLLVDLYSDIIEDVKNS